MLETLIYVVLLDSCREVCFHFVISDNIFPDTKDLCYYHHWFTYPSNLIFFGVFSDCLNWIVKVYSYSSQQVRKKMSTAVWYCAAQIYYKIIILIIISITLAISFRWNTYLYIIFHCVKLEWKCNSKHPFLLVLIRY